MKSIVLLLAVACLSFSPGNPPDIEEFIDPTGTYVLRSISERNKVNGHTGEIKVRLLNGDSIAISFVVSSGAPSYRTASIIDTLRYQFNRVIYKPFPNANCGVVIVFHNDRAETRQSFRDPGDDCGFGKDVMVSAFFEKYSDEPPYIRKHNIQDSYPN